MKHVYIWVAIVILLAILFGGVIPMLISANADLAVILGFGLILAVILSFVHYLHARFFKKSVDPKPESK